MAKLVSSTYGDALFELALEEGHLAQTGQEIGAVRQIFLENEDLSRLLGHPEVSKEEKLAFVKNVFEGRVSDDVMGFIHIIVEKDRQDQIIPIFDHFLRRVKVEEGTGTAYVTSAVELRPKQKEALEERLLKTTRYTSFDIHYQVAPEILGGLVIRVGDRVVDSSLKTQIDKLGRQLSQVRLPEE